jgi:O-acetyl-ADP-ribose deacetylase (regulator of RNase III)
MNGVTTQEQRLEYLLEAFKADSGEYKNLDIPNSIEGKKRVLRFLMNVRMPGQMDAAVLGVQDAYLQVRAEEKGIVRLADIPTAKEALGSARRFADTLSLWQGDITRLAVDAIINAANSQMLGCFIPMHTCIDNTIHTFAGVQLREECNRQMERLRAEFGRDYEQPTAVPMLTDAYNLPAKKIVHIVGPIVQYALTEKLETDLFNCYKNTLDMCLANGLKSVAFCCISTGVFRFPNKRAAEIAVAAVERWLAEHPGGMERIIFNVFKDEDRNYYEELIH